MDRKMIIAPSVLSMDYSRMAEQLKEIEESDAEWLHFDVMDGHFVPNLTFGPDILKGFRKASDLFLDVHVMIDRPLFFAEKFLSAGADNYTFHYEAVPEEEELRRLAGLVRSHGKFVGISIKPDTPVSVLKPYLDLFDVFLIMSVEYISSHFEDIRKYADIIEKRLDDSWLTPEALIEASRREPIGTTTPSIPITN